jgi:iron complex transport system substrate-binding protein
MQWIPIRFNYFLFFAFTLLSISSLWASPEIDCDKKLKDMQVFVTPEYAKQFEYFLGTSKAPGGAIYIKDMKRIYYWGSFKSKIQNCKAGSLKLIELNRKIERSAVMSTTFLPAFDILGKIKTIVAVSSLSSVSNKKLRTRAKNNKNVIKDLGFVPNPESVLGLKLDLFFASTPYSTEVEGLDKLEHLNIPVFFISDYKETHPLARAEWIKVFAMIFSQEKEGIKIFETIKKEYLRVKKSVQKFNAPKVLIGEMRNGRWTAPSGDSFISILLKDAGGDYIFDQLQSKKTLSIDLEKILKGYSQFDVWLPHNLYKKRSKLLAAHSLMFSKKDSHKMRIFNNTKRYSKGTGNDFWESALSRPDLLLKDLAFIFHQKKLGSHELVWYEELL